MAPRNRPLSIQYWLLAILSLVAIAALTGRALAQEGDGTVAVVPEGDMWDCTNRQSFFNYPAGEVTAVTLNPNNLTINLASGIGDPYSLAVVARIDYDGGSEKAMYQIHDTVQSTGYLDPTTGFPIPGTESQVVISGTLDTDATTTISFSPAISATVVNLDLVSGGVITGTAISGQMPPIQPGDPNIYVQVNTFYLPTANDIRACGEYLVYFAPASEVDAGRADGIHDGLLCNSGVKPFAVPPGLDLTAAYVGITDGAGQAYLFTLEFGRVTALTEPIAGGIELYDPTGDLVVDPNWLFNNTGNWSFNFAYSPPDTFNTFASRVIDGSWEPIADAAMIVHADGNKIVMEIGSDQFSESVETWFATVTNFNICDEVGLGPEKLPILPLPPGFVQATETFTPNPPTATSTTTPTATVASPTPTATVVPEEPEEPVNPSPIPTNPFCGQIVLFLGLISLAMIRKTNQAERADRRSRPRDES